MAKKKTDSPPPSGEMKLKCPVCQRTDVHVRDGKIGTHGPGPQGHFVCPGTGDKGMVRAGSFKV